ncbi:hypothetical protein JB92DRAFT_3127419 [Gautieria morchelliformis]|nr:hypothetical protein JB92DRAFT_3127419 [Gautieria morchelliformis]
MILSRPQLPPLALNSKLPLDLRSPLPQPLLAIPRLSLATPTPTGGLESSTAAITPRDTPSSRSQLTTSLTISRPKFPQLAATSPRPPRPARDVDHPLQTPTPTGGLDPSTATTTSCDTSQLSLTTSTILSEPQRPQAPLTPPLPLPRPATRPALVRDVDHPLQTQLPPLASSSPLSPPRPATPIPAALTHDIDHPLQIPTPTGDLDSATATTTSSVASSFRSRLDQPLQTSPPTAGLEVPTTARVEFSTVARTSQIPYTVPPITFYWAPDARVTPKSQLTRSPISRPQKGTPVNLIDPLRRPHATQEADIGNKRIFGAKLLRSGEDHPFQTLAPTARLEFSNAAITSGDTSNSRSRPIPPTLARDVGNPPQAPTPSTGLETWAPTARLKFSTAAIITGTPPTLARDVDHPPQTATSTAGLEFSTPASTYSDTSGSRSRPRSSAGPRFPEVALSPLPPPSCPGIPPTLARNVDRPPPDPNSHRWP